MLYMFSFLSFSHVRVRVCVSAYDARSTSLCGWALAIQGGPKSGNTQRSVSSKSHTSNIQDGDVDVQGAFIIIRQHT